MKTSKHPKPCGEKPTRNGSLYGCCVCAKMEAPMPFILSTNYEAALMRCFQLTERRTGKMCNYCVRKIRRWTKEEAIAAASVSGARGPDFSSTLAVPGTSAMSSTLAVPGTSVMPGLLEVPGISAMPSSSAGWTGGADVVDFRSDANPVVAPQLPDCLEYSPLSWRTVHWPLVKPQPVRLDKKKNLMATAASATVVGPGPSTSSGQNHPDKSYSFQPESPGIAGEMPRLGRPPKKKQVDPKKSAAAVHPMNPDKLYSFQSESPGTAGEMPRWGCPPMREQAGLKKVATIRPMNANNFSVSSYSTRSESPEIVFQNPRRGPPPTLCLDLEILKACGFEILPPPLVAFSDTRAVKRGPGLIQDSAAIRLGTASSSHGAPNFRDIENRPSTSRTDDCSSSGSQLKGRDVDSSPSHDHDLF